MLNLPPKSRSPNRVPIRRLSSAIDAAKTASPGSYFKRASNIGGVSDRTLREIQSPQVDEWKGDAQQQPINPRFDYILTLVLVNLLNVMSPIPFPENE